MSVTPFFVLVVAALAAQLILLIVLLRRSGGGAGLPDAVSRFDALDRAHERLERLAREDTERGREEARRAARELREEVTLAIQALGDSVVTGAAEQARIQRDQLTDFRGQLERSAQSSIQQAEALRGTIEERIRLLQEETAAALRQARDEATASSKQMRDETALSLHQFRDSLGAAVTQLTTSTEQKLEGVRTVVEARLRSIQEDNTKQLEQMRATVDEKLQGALEQRLGESFRLVSDRLEQVHRGLGEMQSLASGVGDLKRVLTNVKMRGTWGEVQLSALLEQVLTPEQYATNVATRPESGQRVEFAIKLPGRGDSAEDVVWLPIDAKFPQEDYLALITAQEAGDVAGVDAAGKRLEARVRGCARDICEKYLNPPLTTDFGILFLPTEGLYAEVIRRPGLMESLTRECRVMVCGPTTLGAMLNSLQMGFRTLAIERRSSEVWGILAGVKSEFGKFGGVIQKLQKKLSEASNVVEAAATRTRVMERRLKDVEAMPTEGVGVLVGAGGGWEG